MYSNGLDIKDAAIFDQENVFRYQKDIWNSRYKLGLWFSALEELGESLFLNIGLQKTGSSYLQWFKVPHALHDALSALKVLTQEQKIDLQIPSLSVCAPISNKFKNVWSVLRSGACEKHFYRHQDKSLRGTDFDFICLEFPIIDSRLSKTAILAKIIAQTFMQELSANTTSRWMIPVRLREDTGLHASYLGLNIGKNDSEKDLHYRLVKKLKNGEHWGYYYLSKAALIMGRKSIMYLTKKSVSSGDTALWMGSISNLGNFEYCKQLDKMVALAPVRFHRPISAILYELNGKQFVNISVHKSLREVDLDGIKQRITAVYQSY